MTVDILALGETLSEFKQSENITIGVNDIHSKIKTDFVVCVDSPKAFKGERLESLKATNCKGFYSQVEDWKNLPNFNLIEFNLGRGLVDGLDNDKFCYSISSPYVAVILAYKMKARNIVLYGADYQTHPNFIDDRIQRVLKDFKTLRIALNKRGVGLFVCSEFSELSRVMPVWQK